MNGRTFGMICWFLLAVVASAAISGCTGSGSPRPTLGSTASASPSSTALFSGTARAGSPATTPPHTTAAPTIVFSETPASPSPTATASATVTPGASTSPSPSPSSSPVTSSSFPTAAPPTGGGGTAGFSGTALLALGIASVLAGGASIAYRRKLTRNR